jgi:hypothetical protein
MIWLYNERINKNSPQKNAAAKFPYWMKASAPHPSTAQPIKKGKGLSFGSPFDYFYITVLKQLC